MNRTFQIDLAHYRPISEWEPEIGDIIIYHGWIFHWFGIICQIDPNGVVHTVRSGLPLLLLTMSKVIIEKSTIKVDSADIKSSAGGKYAIIKNAKNVTVWYV